MISYNLEETAMVLTQTAGGQFTPFGSCILFPSVSSVPVFSLFSADFIPSASPPALPTKFHRSEVTRDSLYQLVRSFHTKGEDQ